jgi:hypothetical protein
MKAIVAYLTSGMGSRLRPLASCYAAAQHSGRKLLIYWDNITPNGCLARWDELFQNQFEFISLEEIKQLDNCVLFTEAIGDENHSAEREYQKFGRDALKFLGSKYPKYPRNGFNYSYTNQNIIIYEDNFLGNVDQEEANKFLRSLKPIEKLQDSINEWSIKLNLNKEIIGIHARGTDVGMSLDYYISQIRSLLSKDFNTKFFLITDDESFEKEIFKLAPERILIRPKNIYTRKVNQDKPWNDHNNIYLITENVQDTVIDVWLLAKTNIQVYHPNSAISAIARIIS